MKPKADTENQENKNCLEVELLLCTARTYINPSTVERIQVLLQQDLDWTCIIQMAARHRVMPLLYQNLINTYPEAISQPILAQLRNHFQSNAVRNLFFTQALLNLLALLKKHQIRAIPFKGPVLAVEAYGNLALRQFGDLDILVHEQDFLKARELLISEGFRPVVPSSLLTETQEKTYICEQGECSLMDKQGKFCVDLHGRLVAGYLFALSGDFDSFWNFLEPVSLTGNIVTSFRTEDLLLYLCIHGAKSYWERLGWICDIAELVRTHPDLNWEILMERSKALGCRRMLLLGCFLASELLGTKFSEEVYQKIQADSQVKILATQVHQRLQGKTEYPREGEYTFKNFIFHFRAMECTEDRLRYSLKCFVKSGASPLKTFRLIMQK